MTIPIRPTAAWMLAQAFGQGAGALTQARQQAMDRAIQQQQQQRQNDIQNIALWSQILPSLSSYAPPGDPNFGFTGGAPLLAGTPEQFSVPNVPGPIAQSLERITGQGSIGLTPQAKSEFRKGAVESATAPADIRAAGLRNETMAQNLELGKVNLLKGEYDLRTQESRDVAAYTLSVAPSYVQAAIAAGVQPTRANAKKLVDDAYSLFVGSDRSPWAPKVSREMFAKAVGEEIDEAEKLGLQWYNAKTSRLSAEDQADPWRRLAASVNAYGDELTRLQVEQQKKIAALGPKALLLGTKEGEKDQAVRDAATAIQALEDAKPALVQRRQQLQNILDAKEGLPALSNEQVTRQQGPQTSFQHNLDSLKAQFSGAASSIMGKQAVKGALITYAKQKVASPADILAFAREFRIPLTEQELMP